MAQGGSRVDATETGDDRATVADIDFLGDLTFPTESFFRGTQVGGLSSVTYDAAKDVFYVVSDDRSQQSPARFYTAKLDLDDGTLDEGDIRLTGVTFLERADGSPYPPLGIDPEGIALDRHGNLWIAQEGQAAPLPGGTQMPPSVSLYAPDGSLLETLPVDDKFLPAEDGSSGVRNNLAFESLTVSPNGKWLWTATENAIVQDGPAASVDSGSLSRIIKYDARTGEEVAEYAYITDPVAEAPAPGGFATNGLVDLLALDDQGTLLAMERSFSTGAPGTGNTIKIYLVDTRGATDISGIDGIGSEIDDGELSPLLDAPVKKELLLDLSDLGIPLDNVEGMTLGPVLEDGRQSLILVSDNNFSETQFTQVLAFALDIDTMPVVKAKVETPDTLRYDSPVDLTEGPDSDDPAIWVNPEDEGASLVITTMKEGGLRVYDLAGQEVQRIEPEVRYNNVDLLYNVSLGGQLVDIAVASDREHDSLAIYSIDKATGLLTDITAGGLSADAFSIFGVDDGEATAYGLAAYTSPVDGAQYVFVTQAGGAQIAQLRITDAGGGKAGAEVVRILELPVAPGDDPEDYQAEGIAIDRETAIGYVTVEGELGLMAFSAEPTGPAGFTTVADIGFEGFTPDLEGVAILYGKNGNGSIFVSSQGDSSFAVFDRKTWEYKGSFAVGDGRRTDGVEESDGLEIFSGSLGEAFPRGVLVTHDGSNGPQAVFPTPDDEDGEVQNFNTNFKYVDLRPIARELDIDLGDRNYDPRDAVAPISGPIDVF
jgi:myo-inositol-hexaphosphate 3-phosphohydrolase